MENYLAIKRNQLLIHIIIQMNLKIFMLSEKAKPKRGYIIYNFIYRNVKNVRYSIITESSSMGAWGQGKRKGGITKGYRKLFEEEIEIETEADRNK